MNIFIALAVIFYGLLFYINSFSEKELSEMKSKAEQKAKLYYLSCMDANETIETLGAEPMIDLLKVVGDWNITNTNRSITDRRFNVSNWNLQNSMHVLQNVYNMGGLFSWAVNEDDRNSTRHIIQVTFLYYILFNQLQAEKIFF